MFETIAFYFHFTADGLLLFGVLFVIFFVAQKGTAILPKLVQQIIITILVILVLTFFGWLLSLT